jgi:hypothetical protein
MTWVFAVPVTGETDADLPLYNSATVKAAKGLPVQDPPGCTLAWCKQVVGQFRAAVMQILFVIASSFSNEHLTCICLKGAL